MSCTREDRARARTKMTGANLGNREDRRIPPWSQCSCWLTRSGRMVFVTHAPRQACERRSLIEEFIHWRREMEAELLPGSGNIMKLMWARNQLGPSRDALPPDAWFRCPACGGRGLWVSEDNRNRYCKRCSGTAVLLVCELTDPAEIALVRKTSPPPDWGRLLSEKVRMPAEESHSREEP
jgi:hypothetical protein